MVDALENEETRFHGREINAADYQSGFGLLGFMILRSISTPKAVRGFTFNLTLNHAFLNFKTEKNRVNDQKRSTENKFTMINSHSFM